MPRTTRPAPAGVDEGDATAWRGIRYAHAQRFCAPVIADLDTAARYDTYGAAPFQIEDPLQPLGAPPSEDCHFLNVWAPRGRAAGTRLPVVVSVYGGGFEHGSSSSWVADGCRVAATGRAVFVSFNYRVGALGFATLDHRGPEHAETSNLGLRDTIAALTWVQREIDRFGGDPDAVTVVGESAGGFITSALAAAPAAAGLFHRLAVFSAGASRIIPLSASRAMGGELENLVSSAAAEDAAAAPPELWTEHQGAVTSNDIGERNGPLPRAFGIVDDHDAARPVLSGHPMAAVEKGALRDVPVLVSALRDEIALFREMAAASFDPVDTEAIVDEVCAWGVSRERAVAIVADVADELAGDTARPAATDAAATVEPGELRAAVLTDYIYRLPAVRLACAQAEAGGTAHLQLIGRVDGAPAGHALDVPALVGAHWPDSTPAAIDRDREIFRVLLDFVTDAALDWPAVTRDTPHTRGIGDLGGDATEISRRILRRWHGVPRT